MELGYTSDTLVRSLSARRTGTLALALPYAAAFWDHNPFNRGVINGAAEAAARRGYNLLLKTGRNHGWHQWDAGSLMDPHADGVLIVTPPVNQSVLAAVAAAGYPAVAAVCDPRHSPIPCVNGDDAEGTRAAVTYLIRLGHRHIGYLTGPKTLAPSHERLNGFRTAMAAFGLDVSDQLIARISPEHMGGYRGAVELLTRRPRPTALLAFNDLAAAGVMDAARQMGLQVPEQLAVIGFDDADLAAQLHPPLTTVRYPTREIAAQAIECLAHILQTGDLAPRSVVVPIHLVVRHSTAPAAPETPLCTIQDQTPEL